MTKRLGSAAGSICALATSALRPLARAPRRAALVAVLGLGASALATLAPATLAPATSASADSAPVPFTCLTPTDFVLSGTTLYTATEPATGLPTPVSGQPSSFTKLTDDFSGLPNALAFDPADGLLYAVMAESNVDHLLQIDSTGTVTDLGVIPGNLPGLFTGGFDPSGTYWVAQGNGDSDDVWAIDVSSSPLTVTPYKVSPSWQPDDWTYANGYFWGDSGGGVWQFDPATQDIHEYGSGVNYEGAWTFANGDLGFYDAGSGTAMRVSITTGSSGNPTYTTEANGSGWPEAGTADATSCAQVAITTPALAPGDVGQAYSATLAATGGPTPPAYSWAVTSGALPAGLSLDPSSGTISGTPTALGASTFTVQVTAGGAFPVTATQTYTLTVGVMITSTTLPDGTYGTPYSTTLSAVSGTTPYTWSVASGSLPPGLSLDPSSGIISGMPMAAGSYSFTAEVADSSSPQQTATQPLTLTVDPAQLTANVGAVETYGGAPPPTFVVTSYTGLVNGDTGAAISGTLSDCLYVPGVTAGSPASAGATGPTGSTGVPVLPGSPGTPPGTYPGTIVGCFGLSSPNYTISYTGGDLTVNPAPLTITASSGSMAYGQTPPAITPSYSGFVNGDSAASLTTQPTCTTAATAVSPAGAYPSSCSGAADPDYAISYVNGAVTVSQATLTITASSESSTYGSAPGAITPSYSGFVNGDSATSLTTPPVCTTTAAASSPTGTYPSTCSGAVDANYTISYEPGTVTVSPAPLTITASSGSSTYGQAPPAVNPSYSGFVNGDTAASLTTAPTCATAATAASSVGTFATSCSGAADANYTISYVDGTMTVTPAALAITASGGSSTYGQAPPAITASYAGFVNGDTSASLTTQPVCTTTATASSPAGTYPSTCSGATDPNYLISYVNGSVAVAPAALTVTASGGSSTYGQAPPAIAATYAGFVNGDSATSLTTPPACTTTATASSPAGTYPSTCSGATDPNYAISYVAGTVTVGQAALTITASGGSSTYGQAPPAIAATYAGFVNGDTAASLTTPPACTTTATASSPAGTYPSTCSGAIDPNYAISYVTGTITVSPAGTTLAYTGPSSIGGGSALVPAASLTSSASACQAGQPVSFSLNANPTTGATGSYSLGSATTNSSGTATGASVSTSGWEAGAYTITASYAGTANCDAASVTAPLAVTEAGDVAAGAGTYLVHGAPVAFGFVVWRIPLTSIYLGGISVVGGGWSLTGSVTGYSLTSGTQGLLAGTGILSWWNPALNHGRGGWQVASTSVSYTATFSPTSKTSPGSFGIQINYTPVSPQPSTLPDSAAATLKSGLIVT